MYLQNVRHKIEGGGLEDVIYKKHNQNFLHVIDLLCAMSGCDNV